MAEDWRVAICDILGAPSTGTNLAALHYWAVSEGMPDRYNNWLATTQDGYGGTVVNSVGVKAYPSVEDGAAATVKTLTNGRYNGVVEQLRYGKSIVQLYAAINDSPWCGGCQGGHYPIALYNYVESVLHAVVPPPTTKAVPQQNVPSTNRDNARAGWGNFVSYWNEQLPAQTNRLNGFGKAISAV